MTKIYCETCGKKQPLIIEPMSTDELNAPAIWGDLICGKCHSIVATLEVDEPGVYEFRKVKDVED